MMKKYGLFGFLGCFCLSAVLTLPARAQDASYVFIAEINWAGSEISTADEWLELVNLGETAVDLSRYVLTGTATSGGAIEIAEGTIIEPQSTLLIANYALGDPKTSLLIAPALVTTAISLPNSGLNILLADATGLVIDSYVDTGTPDFGLSNPATSIERDLSDLTWRSSTQNLNLSSISQFGTPGTAMLPIMSTEPIGDIAPPAIVVAPVVVEPEPIQIETPIVDVPSVSETPTNVGEPDPVESVTEPIIVEPAPEPIVIAPVIIASPGTGAGPSPAPTSEAPPPPTPVIPAIAPGELILNELVSDPVDGVEWVEIWNATAHDINLAGCTLQDAGAHVTNLPLGVLPTDEMIVIENPNGNLNNGTETIKLFDSYGTLLDAITYGTTALPAPTDGESLAKNSDGEWSIATATRNAMNHFAPIAYGLVDDPSLPLSTYDPLSTNLYETPTDDPDAALDDSGTFAGPVETVDDATVTATEPVHRIVAIAQPVDTVGPSPTATRQGRTSTTQSVITGTVVALPGTFGKQIMFLDGHEIYFHAADWPALALGDSVQITGTESTSNGNTRLKASSNEAIVVTGHVEPVPTSIAGSELTTTPHGLLISITGRVISKEGDKLLIMTDDGVTITALGNKRTGVSWSKMQSGIITLVGIVRHTDSGSTIAVRSADDVHFTAEAIIAPTSQTSESPTRSNTTPIVGGGLLTGSIGALGTWYLRSRKGIFSLINS